MSEEQLKAFLEKVKADTTLQEKLKGAADSDAVLAIAKAAGFSITTKDLNSHSQNLPDDELEAALGGTDNALNKCTTGCSPSGEVPGYTKPCDNSII
ncbi:Nif11-like leader peptide family natural product precursor [Synechococcus sp. BIOS-E4-1]|uniref:Nif11-like leader peptide family natural product precursor n=1 Tax=Synechococcus sp. BIOS-E4-1 TaxID=1400864 RepID=UPI00164774A8|nr:Nif11-like leader peptide family natural product precursor [Synechococcus sp. BIOS-E4-1]